ncbi:MAG: 16S rRNA (uracil(1498)-N(3))-methyltransferase [Lachnospiraceae bacterium]|nr:16S rRNA (uracil(1498)-N(3))-methyltransferase [Lachnospiraceae bacterium]
MYHFYTEKSNISEDTIYITGEDVNHIKNVLRMKEGEEIIICDSEGTDYHTRIKSLGRDEVVAEILSSGISEAEMPFRVHLFQGLPKKDKMEMIIQKSVELGVFRIIPVMTKRVIVKLDDKKKEEAKNKRWQAISESAAKQSGRGIIPEVSNCMSFKEALKAAGEMDVVLIPYENADSSPEGMKKSLEMIKNIPAGSDVAIFIGPEGGFEPTEVEEAINSGAKEISLGKRILRTETAGMMLLSVIGFVNSSNII